MDIAGLIRRRANVRWGAAMLLLAIPALAGDAGVKPEAVNIALKVRTLDGMEKTPFHLTGKKAAVFLFVVPDCPITNQSAPEIRRIAREFAAKPVAFNLVYADPAAGRKEIEDHVRTYGLSGFQVFVDQGHVLAKSTGATVTPEAVVTDAAGRILYRGRIDDAVAEISKPRREPSQHDQTENLAFQFLLVDPVFERVELQIQGYCLTLVDDNTFRQIFRDDIEIDVW